MGQILSSASKIVFIVMAVASVIGLFLKVIDAKDWLMLAGMAFSFYFTKVDSARQNTAE